MSMEDKKKSLYDVEISRNMRSLKEDNCLKTSNTYRKSKLVLNNQSNNTLNSASTTKYLKTEDTRVSSFWNNSNVVNTCQYPKQGNRILMNIPTKVKGKNISTLENLLESKDNLQKKNITQTDLFVINSSRNHYIKSKSNELRKIYSNFLYIKKNYSKKKVNIVGKNITKHKLGSTKFNEFSYRMFHSNMITSSTYWFPVKHYTQACYGSKSEGVSFWYGVNSHIGKSQVSNNDRIKIILNIPKPKNYSEVNWPICSYFAMFSGYNGNKCAEYLKDNLHHSIFSSQYFPSDICRAIYESFKESERNIVNLLKPSNSLFSNNYDKSSACALIVIIVNHKCYAVNLGNSKIILSEECSNRIYKLFKEHNITNSEEVLRVQEIINKKKKRENESDNNNINDTKIILPGNRTITRIFGDIEVKNLELFNDPKLIIAVPEIAEFDLTNKTDFILLGNSGIFQKLSCKDALNCIYESTNEEVLSSNTQEQCGKIVDIIMKSGISRKTSDNLTCIFICFQNFKYNLFERCERNSIQRKEFFQSCKKQLASVEIRENLSQVTLDKDNLTNNLTIFKEINSSTDCFLHKFIEKRSHYLKKKQGKSLKNLIL